MDSQIAYWTGGRADLAKKAVRKRRNVLAAISERGHVDANHRKTSEQFVSNASFLDGRVDSRIDGRVAHSIAVLFALPALRGGSAIDERHL